MAFFILSCDYFKDYKFGCLLMSQEIDLTENWVSIFFEDMKFFLNCFKLLAGVVHLVTWIIH